MRCSEELSASHLVSDNRHLAEAPDPRYWTGELAKAVDGPEFDSWYRYMNRIYARLVSSEGPSNGIRVNQYSLKTDLFEEAVSCHGPIAQLTSPRLGIDLSLDVVRSARQKLLFSRVPCEYVVCDVRRLPFRSDSIGSILSGSTLDHFATRSDLSTGLRELGRVLARGGKLILTLDNIHNPLIKLRSRLPDLCGMRMSSYKVGETLALRDAQTELRSLGLTVVSSTAVAHAPRDPAMRLVRFFEWLGARQLARLLARCMELFEILMHLPTRYKTGYYLAFSAVKPVDGVAAGTNRTRRP